MAGKFQVSTIFKAHDRMTAPLRRISNRMSSFMRATSRGLDRINRRLTKMNAGIKAAGSQILIGAAVITAGLSSAANAGMDFEQTMVNAGAKFPGMIQKGSEQFRLLEEAARNVGGTTEFTASQAAQALNFYAMAGFNAEQSIASLPLTVDLATAAQTDLATAADIASDALGAFNLTSGDAQKQAQNLARVTDVLAVTANTSNTSITGLFEAMKKGGPVATAAGKSIEDVAAMAGIMANAGIKGERAGTGIANAFLNMSKPSKQAEAVLQRLGIQLQDTNGELLDMPAIIKNVNSATAGLTKTQRQAAIETLFGREGLAGIIAVLNQGSEAYAKYRARIEGSNGETKKIARVMRDTARGDMKALESAIESVSIALFDQNRGPMREAIQTATAWVRANEQIIAQNIGEVFKTIAENIDEIIFGMKALAGIVATIWAMEKAFKAVRLVMITIEALQWAWNRATLATTASQKILGGTMAANKASAAAGAGAGMGGKTAGLLAAIPLAMEARPGGSLSAASLFGDNVLTRALDRPLGEWFGGDGEEKKSGTAGESTQQPRATVSSPEERTARSIEQRTEKTTNEVVIRDETGRAEWSNNKNLPPSLQLIPTGGF